MRRRSCSEVVAWRSLVGEQEEVKEILDRPVRMVDMHRPDRGLSIPRLAQALMQGQRFIERRDDQESENSSVAFCLDATQLT